jgi:hypothetical protein
VINSSFLNNQSGNFSAIQNGLDPLTQGIVVEAGTFPQGTFLESIDLYFREVDENSPSPVTIQIRPMINGTPHDFAIVPHSTVTVIPTVTSNGPNRSLGTNFKFSSPVYLPVGTWAVCVYSNSDKNILFKCTIGEPWLSSNGTPNPDSSSVEDLSNGAAGVRFGSLFLPLNNGSRTENTNESLMMDVNRCRFIGASSPDQSNRNLLMNCDFSGTDIDASSMVLASNEQLFTSSNSFVIYDVITNNGSSLVTYNGVSPNKTLVLTNRLTQLSSLGDVKSKVRFSQTSSTD